MLQLEEMGPRAPVQSAIAQAIVEGARDAVWCCAPDRTVIAFNAAAEALYGRGRDDLLGGPLESITGPERAAGAREVFAQVLSGRAPAEFETRHRRADGTAIEVAITASPIVIGGECFGVSYFVRDIGARLAAERELARTRAELERHSAELTRSNRDLEQFAYIASHDLSEPLRAITGMLALLQDEFGGRLDEEADDYIRRATAAASRMRALIDDLLAYSRVGRAADADAPVALDDMMRDVVAGLDDLLAERAASVTVVAALPEVVGSASQLRQLLQNLVANAVKFTTAEHPRVEVGARRDADAWTITVDDDGIGIPVQHRARVFGVFKRLHTRDAYSGTGIGLAICQRVVERHGGRIWVEESPLGGTRAAFTLPVSGTEGEHHA